MASSHVPLKADPSLSDIQKYIAEMGKRRGFDKDSLEDNFIMLTEELGELAKALRPIRGVTVADDSELSEVEHEVADVLWMLVCVCNKLDINLESAFRSKEKKNATRVWR